MRKINLKEIDTKVPGLVINSKGEYIVMDKNDYHRLFFNKIIRDNLNLDLATDDLVTLTTLIIKDLGYLPYIGCTSGERNYEGGILLIKDIDSLTDEQIISAINLYTLIASNYDMEIITIDHNEVSLGELYEEMLNRPKKAK